MGNIQHKLFPPTHNNGDNPSTRSQSHNNSNTSDQIGGFNPVKQSLLQLTISDNIQYEQIMGNMAVYSVQNGVSPSISQLKEYYRVKREGYCTTQYVFYLVFGGCGCCGLKDQFGVRKMVGGRFQDQQILAIIKTYLAGVLVYTKEFKRKIDKIDLDDIGFEPLSLTNEDLPHTNQPNSFNQAQNAQNHLRIPNKHNRAVRMYFIDPWLKQRRQQQIISVNEVNVLLQNPSPQRLDESYNLYNQFNNRTQNGQINSNTQKSGSKGNNNSNRDNEGYSKKLQSLLFSVGVIGLKMLEMGFVDDIYVKLPQKKVNFEKVQQYIEKHNTALSNRVNNSEKHNITLSNRVNNPNSMGSFTQTNGYHGLHRLHENYTTTTASMIRQKLIGGLKILLLSNTPKEREKIYQFWNINLNQTNILIDISLENGSHLQPEPQLSTQPSELPPNTVTNAQRQNFNSYQTINQDQTHRLKGNSDNIVNTNIDNKINDYVNRSKLYSTDDPTLKNPNMINTNLFSQKNDNNNRNDPNNHSRQYVYKVDQFRHHPEPTNSQQLTNYHNIPQQPSIHIQKPQQPKIISNPNNHPQFHPQPTFPTQINNNPSNHPNYYHYASQTKPFYPQYSPPSLNPNHIVPPNQISQNAYFSRLQYKLLQKSTT